MTFLIIVLVVAVACAAIALSSGDDRHRADGRRRRPEVRDRYTVSAATLRPARVPNLL